MVDFFFVSTHLILQPIAKQYFLQQLPNVLQRPNHRIILHNLILTGKKEFTNN